LGGKKKKEEEEVSQSYCLDTVINTCRRGQVEFLKYSYMDLDCGLPWASHASIYLPDDREYMEIMIMINCHTRSTSIRAT